jgi:hypothetical protein
MAKNASLLPTVVLNGLMRGLLLTATDVAGLFGRETRSVKRWLLRSSFPRPDLLVDIPFGPRAGRCIRVWRRETIVHWFGRPIGPGEIMTTADLAVHLSKSVRDIKRFLAAGEGHCVPPTQTVVMTSGRGSSRSIRLWHKADVDRWFDVNGEFCDFDEFEEGAVQTGNPGKAPQLSWRYELPSGITGTVDAPTKSEARAIVKKQLGLAKNGRLPVATLIQQVKVDKE